MNTDYLKWDAESIQQLLRRKLLEQGVYTDQLYPGSDTKVILDLFAWTFDVLTYILNNNASDSLFADTVIYENLNRIVKLLSYNPDGFHSSNTTFQLAIQNQYLTTSQDLLPDVCVIPRFSSIDLGKNDQNGNPIKYSFVNDYSFSVYNTPYGENSTIITPDYWPVLYNGQFKKYSEVFSSVNIPYETFLLNSLDIEQNIYVDHDNFHIYIETIDEETGQSIYTEWNRVENLVLQSSINSQDYQIRLNENKQYVITFGDNIHGKQLNYGDKIHVIYLQSNVEQGKIENGQVSVETLELKINGFTNITQLLNMCFGGLTTFKRKYKGLFIENNVVKESCSKLVISNIKQSSQPQTFQDVQKIRFNAPGMFRMGNRLVTIEDYKTYFLTKFSYLIRDCWVCNNTTYLTSFYNWLYKYNKLTVSIRKQNYLFSDTCDFNNIYVWLKANTKSDLSNDDMNLMINKSNTIKTATVEIVPCNAIVKYYMPFVDHIDYPIDKENTDWGNWNPNIKIRIVKKPGTYVTNSQIKSEVEQIITEYFDIKNQTLGNNIKIEQIYKKIMQSQYIQSVKTVNIPDEDSNNEYIIEGLSFACFSVKIIDGADFEIIKYNDQLLPFQFAQLYKESIIDCIEIQNTDTFSLINSGF